MTTPSKVYVPDSRIECSACGAMHEGGKRMGRLGEWSGTVGVGNMQVAADAPVCDACGGKPPIVLWPMIRDRGGWPRVEPAPTSPAREDRLFTSGCAFCGKTGVPMNGKRCDGPYAGTIICHGCLDEMRQRYPKQNPLDAEMARRRSLASQSGEEAWVPAVGDIVNGLGAGSYSRENGDRFEGRVLNFTGHSGFRCVTIATEREGDRCVMIDSLRLIRRAGQVHEMAPHADECRKCGLSGLAIAAGDVLCRGKPTPAVDAGGGKDSFGLEPTKETARLKGAKFKMPGDMYRAAMIAQCQHLNHDPLRCECPDCGASDMEIVASRPGTKARMGGYQEWSARQGQKQAQALAQLSRPLKTGPLRDRDKYGQKVSLRGWDSDDVESES
jgi:hypothetical protein